MISLDKVTTGSANGSAATTVTWSHAVGTGNNRILIVTHPESRSTTSTVTYGGTSLTLAVEETTDSSKPVRIFYLINPPVGTADIVITYGTSTTYRIGGAVSLFGVHQTDPIPTTSKKSSTGNPKEIEIVTKYNNSWLVDAFTGHAVHTAGTDQILIIDGDNRMSSYKKDVGTAGTKTMSYSSTSGLSWNFAVVEVREAVGNYHNLRRKLLMR